MRCFVRIAARRLGTSWRLSVLLVLLAAASVSPSPLPAAEAVAARLQTGQAEPVTFKPPLSTIVEIQNHGERFFDESDAAVAALNRIAENDEIWDAARAAKARADANPDDPQAQQEYRAARARFFHQRIQMLLEAINQQIAVKQSHEAFCNQLNVEIAAVQQQAATEEQAVRRHEEKYRQYIQQLHQVGARIDGVEDLDPAALGLMKDIQRQVASIEHHRVLGKERELLATESLNDLRETKIQADRRFSELQDEFAQAKHDLGLLQEIARNDWMIVTRDKRKVILSRYQQRRPITASENRQVVSELMGRIRDRQIAWAAGQTPPEDPSVSEARAQVQAFLKSLPVVDSPESETQPTEADSTRN
jgi:hypothetical protein